MLVLRAIIFYIHFSKVILYNNKKLLIHAKVIVFVSHFQDVRYNPPEIKMGKNVLRKKCVENMTKIFNIRTCVFQGTFMNNSINCNFFKYGCKNVI